MSRDTDSAEKSNYAPGKVINTAYGPVQGFVEDGVHSYLGIPYGASTAGDMRWRPPRPTRGWKETLRCMEFGPSCPQTKSKFLRIGEMSEDCLYLNVWTANPDPGSKMPVMFWLQGGGFQTGSAGVKLYNGRNIAGRNVVVVSINYRVGPLGFLVHPGLSAESPEGVSGNYGLLDQILALEWVRDNIEAFGGDASQVTLFGFSSGANSIVDLMVCPGAEGLFSRAIIESGPLWIKVGLPSACVSLEEGEVSGLKAEKALGFSGTGSDISRMREVDPAVLLEVAGSDGVFIKDGMLFCPVADGKVIPGHPMALFDEDKQLDIPVIIGTNLNETNLFLYLIKFTREQYEMLVRTVAGSYADEILEMYPVETDEEAGPVFGHLMTAGEFTAPARFVANCMGKKSHDCFYYQFTGYRSGDPLKASHGAEVAYVFGNLSRTRCDDSDRELSRITMGYWVNFARNGNPNGGNLPVWPAYDSGEEHCMILGKPVSLEKRLWKEICELAEEIHRPLFMDA
ncbi:MAG: carboxylesterase family protein [Actinobacteria bacterium]|nr:carboxylesterase family protein [Actinomycetota bacterium]